jgi:hypothetical protein
MDLDMNLGIMTCEHRRYALGNGGVKETIGVSRDEFTSWNQVAHYLKRAKEATVILPLYLYDHSGIAISTESFLGRAPHAEWDSGQVGIVWCTNAMIREYFGISRVTPATLDKARALLKLEVKGYDDYLQGGGDE